MKLTKANGSWNELRKLIRRLKFQEKRKGNILQYVAFPIKQDQSFILVTITGPSSLSNSDSSMDS